jgi:hypothetical protein
MPHRILKEDWSDYDNRKKRWQDRYFFSCEEEWDGVVTGVIDNLNFIKPQF